MAVGGWGSWAPLCRHTPSWARHQTSPPLLEGPGQGTSRPPGPPPGLVLSQPPVAGSGGLGQLQWQRAAGLVRLLLILLKFRLLDGAEHEAWSKITPSRVSVWAAAAGGRPAPRWGPGRPRPAAGPSLGPSCHFLGVREQRAGRRPRRLCVWGTRGPTAHTQGSGPLLRLGRLGGQAPRPGRFPPRRALRFGRAQMRLGRAGAWPTHSPPPRSPGAPSTAVPGDTVKNVWPPGARWGRPCQASHAQPACAPRPNPDAVRGSGAPRL